MSKRRKAGSLTMEIEQALKPGRFVRYNDMFDFVRELEKVQEKIAALAVDGAEVKRAVRLFEVFLAGCYEKIEQCDDSGAHLSMFFTSLFCDWVKARQTAGYRSRETVKQILNWKAHDNYGFCHQIEKEVANVLNPDGYQRLVAHFQNQIETAVAAAGAAPQKAIFEYGNELRQPAISLKEIYQAKEDSESYATLCERLGFSPRDCEHLAEMEMKQRRWERALAWVEKGIALAPARNWHNESSPSIDQLKPQILGKLGRKDAALEIAWTDFEKDPSEFAYEELMKYVPRAQRAEWHARAMKVATMSEDLDSFMDLCVKTKEWEALALRVHEAEQGELEVVSHYSSEPAAAALSKRDIVAAAKLFRALGTRIVRSGKSKYYGEALEHFGKARNLYVKAGRAAEWQAFAERLRAEQSRKAGFMSDFDKIAAGQPEARPSFVERARGRWSKQIT